MSRWAATVTALALLVAAGCADDSAPKEPYAARHPPIVVVVFDEFPTDSLLLPGGRIDAERFPNFARLAATSTWFPNGVTVYDSTFKAVPAILDAKLPRPRTAPDVRSHKPSVYHLVDRLGYDVFKVESASAVCPPDICLHTRTRRPGVLPRLAGPGRPARFHQWLATIQPRERPAFYFHHALLPHEPWVYLPSGHRDRPPGSDPIRGINKPPSFDDRQLTIHSRLRHILQVGFVDRELGLLMRRLRRTGLFDDSLLIVTADHGYLFDMNVASRRLVTDRSVDEVAPVPFFVKLPGQRKGRVNPSLVRIIDIVPTIAAELGEEVWWRHDGAPAFSAVTRARRAVALRTRDFTDVIRIGGAELARRREANRRRWARRYGTGAHSRLLFGDPWTEAYRIGPRRALLGRRVADLQVSASDAIEARVFNAELLSAVLARRELFPTRVAGRLYGVRPGRTRMVAAAVNGRVQAVTRSFHLWRADREFFSMLVPETALRSGSNRLEIFEVRSDGGLVRLALR